MKAWWHVSAVNASRRLKRIAAELGAGTMTLYYYVRNKADIVEMAANIERSLRPAFRTVFDDSGNVGKRYYRQDEIGTPLCITVDYESLEKHDVTVRDRDSKVQERIATAKLDDYLRSKLQ